MTTDSQIVSTGINWQGCKTLFLKEIRRFSKVWLQTLLAPLVTNSLYFLVFGVALGSRLSTIDGVPYIAYVVPGLIMLSMLRNAFLNTSSSLFQSKINGTITDLLVAPMGALEILIPYVAASVIRAFMVGAMIFLVAFFFVDIQIAHPAIMLFFALGVTVSFAFFGLLIALWAEKYDHLSIIPNFILTPATFLGGVFYSIHMLPAPWDAISRANPILYMVNGMRYGMLGITDIPLEHAVIAMLITLVSLGTLCVFALSRGYNLRS